MDRLVEQWLTGDTGPKSIRRNHQFEECLAERFLQQKGQTDL